LIDKAADSCFNRAFTKYIVKEFTQYGFKRYKSRNIARIVNGSILQFINFQKEAHGDKSFTVNIAFRPLYIPHDFLILEPGSRIAKFNNQTDKWWYFTEIYVEDSFKEVSQLLKDKVLYMFNTLSTTDELIKHYNSNIFPISWYSDQSNGFYDLAYLFLKEHRFEEAIDNFTKASELYKAYGFDWSEEKYKECREVLRLCKEEKDTVDKYLNKCEKKSLEVLKIDKELFMYNK